MDGQATRQALRASNTPVVVAVLTVSFFPFLDGDDQLPSLDRRKATKLPHISRKGMQSSGDGLVSSVRQVSNYVATVEGGNQRNWRPTLWQNATCRSTDKKGIKQIEKNEIANHIYKQNYLQTDKINKTLLVYSPHAAQTRNDLYRCCEWLVTHILDISICKT